MSAGSIRNIKSKGHFEGSFKRNALAEYAASTAFVGVKGGKSFYDGPAATLFSLVCGKLLSVETVY